MDEIPELDDTPATASVALAGTGLASGQETADDDCGFVTWEDDKTLAYEGELIDRSADPQQQTITLYLREQAEVESGTLFIRQQRRPLRERLHRSAAGTDRGTTGVP